MNESSNMILHLYQDIPYDNQLEIQTGRTCAAAYEALMCCLDPMDSHAEGCITGFARPTDEIIKRSFDSVWYRTHACEKNTSFVLPEGAYWFRQLPITPSAGQDMDPIVGEFLGRCLDWTKPENRFYIRLYKENRFETVVQILLPKD